MKFTIIALLLSVGVCVARMEAASPLPLMEDSAKETELALSAAPEYLRQSAGVFLMKKEGFVQTRMSRNGFNCIVLRTLDGIVAPVCFDEEGSQTTMVADMRRAELLLTGKTSEETEKAMDQEYRDGKLLAPRKPGLAFMLSADFKQHDSKTGEVKTVYAPHLMFYAPYLKNSDLSLSKDQIGSESIPWVLNEGKPDAYIIVVPRR